MKKLQPKYRTKYSGHCPNCSGKSRGYWKLYFVFDNIKSARFRQVGYGHFIEANTFLICPICKYHFSMGKSTSKNHKTKPKIPIEY